MGGQSRHGARTVIAGRGSPLVAIAELVSSGAGVLGVCADASRRASLAAGAAGLARFNGGGGRVACMRCGRTAVDGAAARSDGGFALIDYATLMREGAGLAERFEQVVLIDPPPSRRALELATAAHVPAAAVAGESGSDARTGYLHRLWTDAEIEFAARAYAAAAPSRETIAAVFRRLRDAGEVGGEELREALAGPGPHQLAAEAAARCLRVLDELELVAGEPNRGGGTVGVVSSGGTDLERSTAFRAYNEELAEAQPSLASHKPQ